MKFQAADGSGEDGKSFLKLKDKESVKGVFRGDPYEFKKHWKDNRPLMCTGPGCPLCASDPKKPSFKFRLNILVNENGQYVSKIFEQGWTVYCQLKDLNADYPLENTVVKITRSGSGVNDTSYSILPAPGGAVTPALEATLSKVPLQVLTQNEDHSQTEHAPAPGPLAANPPVADQQPNFEDLGDLPF